MLGIWWRRKRLPYRWPCNIFRSCLMFCHSVCRLVSLSRCSQVLYQVEGFVDKNNDLLYRDLSQAMWKAGHTLIKSLFPEGNPAKINLKRPPTAGSQFKASVATLMKNLQTKNPNYIRYFQHKNFLAVQM